MRGLITIGAISVALLGVQLTGNYFGIRLFLWAHLAHQFIAEVFLATGGDPYSLTYKWLYVLISLPILVTAVAINGKVLTCVPENQRTAFILPVIAGILAFYATPFAVTPIGVFMALQALVLGVVGIQTRIAAEYLESVREQAPFKTLGLLWLGQSFLFAMHACGLDLNPQGWNSVGEWLPASLVIAGTLKLTWDFLTEGRHETVAKLSAQ